MGSSSVAVGAPDHSGGVEDTSRAGMGGTFRRLRASLRGLRDKSWLVPAVLAALLVLELAVVAFLRPAASLVPQPLAWVPPSIARALFPTPNNNLLVLILLGLLVLVFWLRLETAVDERLRPAHWVATAALVTIVLGAAAYAPCLVDGSVTGLLIGPLGLFAGELGEGSFGAGGVCPAPLPLGLQVAQVLGGATPFIAVIATAVFVLGNQVDGVWTHRSRDVDVVIGLDAASMALMRALVAERRRSDEGDWNGRLEEGRRRHRHGGVVLIHPNPSDAQVGEVRRMGVRVMIGDPLTAGVLTRALTHDRGHRAAVRSMFAVTGSQADNIRIVEQAESILGPTVPSGAGLSMSVVPRLVARFDDPREAHDWRIAHVNSRGCFIDALSSDGLLARQIVEQSGAACCEQMIIDGDTALGVELLNEVFLQRGFGQERMESARAHGRPGDVPADGALLLRRVTVTGPRADMVVGEWDQLRPPGASVAAQPQVCPDTGDLEVVAARECRGRGRTAIVLTSAHSASEEARAIRISRLHGSALVYARAPSAVGIEQDDAGESSTRRLVRYGPTLLEGDAVPEDSWTLLARQGHEVYVAGRQDGRMARRHWGRPGEPSQERLPSFFREDNLRQLRSILSERVEQGFDWVPVAHDAVELGSLDDSDVVAMARHEHERWCDLRVDHGWTFAPPPGPGESGGPGPAKEQELACRNSNLVDWETGAACRPGSGHPGPALPDRDALDQDSLRGLRDFNAGLVRETIRRLRMWGIMPQRRYERFGTVTARQLEEDLEWGVPSGDHFLAHAGDWVVSDDGGNERVVKAGEFHHLYAPEGDGGRYRRTGTVHAARITSTGTVTSLEGDQVAREGDWFVTDPRGNSWPVPDEVFTATYRAVPPTAEAG